MTEVRNKPHPSASTLERRSSGTIGIRLVNICTACGAAGLLGISLWPGYAAGIHILLILLLIGLLGVVWLFFTLGQLSSPGRSPHANARMLVVAPILVCITYLLLRFYVPRRIAFIACQSQFDRCLASAPISDHDGVALNRRLGIYHVDRYAADPKGGVYFRTGTQPDFLAPDTFSYGFVYRPNPTQTPFGRSRYRVRWISGDWYWFQVRD